MRAHLQILSTGTPDCPPSIALCFDTQRYLFNCGEGTQRLCTESRFKYAKLQTMLFTRVQWDCIGGLPGLLLTVSNVGSQYMKIMGPENLLHALLSARFFTYRNRMEVMAIEFNEEHKRQEQDDFLRTTAVFAYPTQVAQDQSTPVHCDPQTQDPTEARAIRERFLTGMFNLTRFGDNIESQQQRDRSGPQEPRTGPNLINLLMAAGAACTPKEAGGAPRMSDADADLDDADTCVTNDTGDASLIKGLQAMLEGRGTTQPRTRPNPVALSYICQCPDYKGKFDAAAARALGVKPGPAYRDLVNGKSVLSTDGVTIVNPEQVIQGARPGRVFIIVDCPSTDYIESLVHSKEFETYYCSSSLENDKADQNLIAECIVHLAGKEVMTDTRYQAWMKRFGPQSQHIIVHEESCGQPLVWRDHALSAFGLSELDQNIFPLPFYDNQPSYDVQGLATSKPLEGVRVMAAKPLMTFHLEPRPGLDLSDVVPIMELERPPQSVSLNHAAQSHEPDDPIPGKDVVLTALGTGSSQASKYRNVSATMLSIPGHGNMLLDVGEGTYGQMFRLFGKHRPSPLSSIPMQSTSVDGQLKALRGIFISHLHADHHLGIVTVIDNWNKLRDKDHDKLYLIGPTKFNSFLSELSDTQNFGYDNVQFIDCADLLISSDLYHQQPGVSDPRFKVPDVITAVLSSSTSSKPSVQITTDGIIHNQTATMDDDSKGRLQGLLDVTGFREILTVPVNHCRSSYGISFCHNQGWRILYSGDTRPAESLVRLGQAGSVPVTVLLHEATFEDDMLIEALKKSHSTMSEALAVGEAMSARFTVLTHFSQRYPNIPRFESDQSDSDEDHNGSNEPTRKDQSMTRAKSCANVGLCFDMMQVRFDEIPRLSSFLPALRRLYGAQGDDSTEDVNNL